MKAPARAAETSTPVEQTEKLYMENTLLRVAGALFCHDAKRAPTHNEEIELNRGVTEKHIVIRPDPKLGQPGPLAHKIFVALIKKHSSYGRPTQADVSFTKRELMRLIGRAEWGGSASEQLERALEEIHYAFVRTHFKSAQTFVEHSFNIFPEIYLERREHATDPIEACTVTLARPIMASLQDGHFTCLNHGLMQQLGTIGQALFMRLFFHFANLYDGHHRNRLSFSKRYDDVCAEWLGGLLVLKYRSKIEQEQLGPHLRQLVKAGFLASYNITEAKGRGGFVINFRPGAAFFADYDRFYRRQQRGSVQFDFHTDRQQIAEPLKVAYLFVEKRNGRPNAGIPYVPSKDVETAKLLLEQIPFADIPDYLDFALAEAKKTRFDVQTLGGLKQYLSRYQERGTQRTAAKASRDRREAEDKAAQRRMDYDRFRRAAADRLFSSLPVKEQAAIEAAAHAKAPRFGRGTGSLALTMFEIERARITAERYPRKVFSFDQWSHGNP
jgi:Replication initiator protein A